MIHVSCGTRLLAHMASKHIKVGAVGEQAVLNHLLRKGFQSVEANFRAKTGEIDLILRKAGKTHFVEVKTVSREIGYQYGKGVSHGTYRPEDNVHRDKLHKILNTIQVWISQKRYEGEWQLDVASVVLDIKNKKATIKYIENVILE